MPPLGLLVALHHCPTDSVCSLTGFALGKAHLPEMCEFARGPRTILDDQECNWVPVPGQVLQVGDVSKKDVPEKGMWWGSAAG